MTSIHGLQYITDQSGHEVSLQISDEAYSVFANDDGALSWTMRDFQSICRSLAINAGLKTHEKIIVSIVFRRMCATQRLTGSSNRRPWLIKQTGPRSSGVTRNSGTPANNLSKYEEYETKIKESFWERERNLRLGSRPTLTDDARTELLKDFVQSINRIRRRSRSQKRCGFLLF